MACSEAPKKKFMRLVPYTPNCEYELLSIIPWGNPKWCNYEITTACKWCGARKRDFGIEEHEAMLSAKQAGGILKNGYFKKANHDR